MGEMTRLADSVDALLKELRQGRTVIVNHELIDTSKRGLLKVRHAAEWLDVTPDTVRKMAREGQIEGRMVNGEMRITATSLNRLAEKVNV